MVGEYRNGRLNGFDPSTLDVAKPWFGAVPVSPELASQWLTLNRDNRRPRKALIEYLARQITNGEWQSDHPQPIVFSDAGRLIDGQHRLIAISISGETVGCKVLCGARDNLRQYLDTGVSRTLEDRVSLIEDPTTNRHVCSIINLLWNIARNRITRPSPDDAKEVFACNPDGLLFAAETAKRNQRGITRASVCASLSEMFRIDQDKTILFRDSLVQVDGPIQQARVLREFLIKSSSDGRGGAQATYDTFRRSAYAMLSYLEGKEMKICRSANWPSLAVPAASTENVKTTENKVRAKTGR